MTAALTTQQRTSRRRRLYLILFSSLLLGAVAVLLAVPELLRWGGVRLLRDQGLAATIEDVDFNPFSGRLTVDRLWTQLGPAPVLTFDRLHLELHWRALFSRVLEVREIRIDDLTLAVEQSVDGALRVAGIVVQAAAAPPQAPDESTGSAPWALKLGRLAWRGGRLSASLPQGRIELGINELRLERLDTGAPQQPLSLVLEASLGASPLRINATATPLSEPIRAELEYRLDELALADYLPWLPLQQLDGALSLDGRVELEHGSETTRVTQQGLLQLEDLRVVREAPGLVRVSRASLQTRLQLARSARDLHLRVESAELNLLGAAAALPFVDAELERFDWRGSIDARQAAELAWQVDGEVQLSGVAGDLLEPPHRLRLAALDWRGEVALRPGAGGLPAVSGNLSLDGLDVLDRNLDIRLLTLQRLDADELQLGSDASLRIARLELVGSELLHMQGAPTVLVLKSMEARGISASASAGARIDSVGLRDLVLDLTRTETGGLVVIDQLLPAPVATAPAATAPAAPATDPGAEAIASADAPPAAAGPGLRIDQLSIGGASRLHFNDRSVEPEFQTELRIDSLQLEGLDTGSPQQPLKFALKASSGAHTRLTSDGEVRPFGVQPAGRVVGKIDHFELQPLSSYTRGALGYQLSSGLADADFEIEVGAGTIEGQTRFDLAGLVLDPSDEDQMQALTKRLSMPLPSALDLLRNSDGHIQLEVPISGRLDDPQFDVSDAINQALGTAMNAGVFAYLKYALQPYGTLISLAQMAGEAATRVRLQPLTFDPGSQATSAESAAYLEKVAALLGERPALTLRICSYYTARDVSVLTPPPVAVTAPGTTATPEPAPPPAAASVAVDPQKLAQRLAQSRAQAIKQRLVQTHSIEPGRLPLCLPQRDKEATAVARVELLI